MLKQSATQNKRPLFFVAHSLGGLICANALSQSHSPDEARENLVEHARGIVFLGTPFFDSEESAVRFGQKVLSITETEKLRKIHRSFATFVESRYRRNHFLEIACYFETRNTGDDGVLVDEALSTIYGYTPLPIDEDHEGMCKFASESHSGFISITDKLNSWIKPMEERSESYELVAAGPFALPGRRVAIDFNGTVPFRITFKD
ncbi:hypothetical protein F4818DRAFT_441506 [Hypoxylon cercidicola]|nr:hypothetical protein F4818DRAFT_441506 [Hypoxylon cercidicola]